MKLKPVGPQPPTELGAYYVERYGLVNIVYFSPRVQMVSFIAMHTDGEAICYDEKLVDYDGAVWQPVAQPEML